MPVGSLDNQVALITGAGRGIGRATALLFGRAGARVVLCARSGREARAAAREIAALGGTALATETDISKPEAVSRLVRAALRRFGRIDILINNAGILGPRIPLAQYRTRDWTRVLDVNLTGTFLVTHAVLARMIPEGRGCIVSLSSSVGRQGRAGWGAYAVSKFGVEGMSQVLAQELASAGIRIMTYNPGGTRTRMRADAYPRENPSRLRTPEAVADDLLRLVTDASPAHSGMAFDRDSIQALRTR
jgi:NAD(P)-dependent dehydrogenase (short-subunit alcohol dehydrogenase family)